MACPYCHATDHSSLGKCPRWTGAKLVRKDLKMRSFLDNYGTCTNRLTPQKLTEVDLAKIELQIAAAVCAEHAPSVRESLHGPASTESEADRAARMDAEEFEEYGPYGKEGPPP